MKIALVVAHSSNRIIGRDGCLPWHLPGDLCHFKVLTTGHAVIMGRKTYESLPNAFRPLPDRANIVISKTMAPHRGCVIARRYDQALLLAKAASPNSERIFIIGGASVYRQALDTADEIYLTLVEDAVDGDVRFPILPHGAWREVERTELFFENDFNYRFIKLERVLR
jgi:dihydrofolate reductase